MLTQTKQRLTQIPLRLPYFGEWLVWCLFRTSNSFPLFCSHPCDGEHYQNALRGAACRYIVTSSTLNKTNRADLDLNSVVIVPFLRQVVTALPLRPLSTVHCPLSTKLSRLSTTLSAVILFCYYFVHFVHCPHTCPASCRPPSTTHHKNNKGMVNCIVKSTTSYHIIHT